MSSKGIVLISGVNGYIGSRIAEAYLEAGYSVRGTVRSIASAMPLRNFFQERGWSDRFEVVEVKDITKPSAFDSAIQGCYAVAHLAQPISLAFTDPKYVINTAVEGTKSILESAKRLGGPRLRSFVLMSSIAAIAGPKEPPHTYTEEEWNEFSTGEVARLGPEAGGGQIYRASKTETERAFWKFREAEKPSFYMTAVNPVLVIGAPLILPEDPNKIQESVIPIWKILSGGDIPPTFGAMGAYVDVRDVARVFVYMVDHAKEVDGERYICCGSRGNGQAMADILRNHYEDRAGIMKTGIPGMGYLPDYSFPKDGLIVSGNKVAKLIRKKWIGFEQSVLDSAKAFEKYL